MESTRKNSQSQAKNKAREHFLWQERVLASGLSPAIKNVACRLALYRNVKTGRCNPSYSAVAEGVGITRRGTIRAIATLEREGWITVERGGHGAGDSNHFRLTFPDQKRDDKGNSRVTLPRDVRVTRRANKGDSRSPEGCPPSHPNKKNMCSPKGEQHGERESRELALAHPDAGGLNAAAPDSREGVAGEERFRELQSVWQQPWPDDAEEDRRAFIAACQLAPPDEIIEAARQHAANADNLRFLPKLAKWLCAQGWKKPPPRRKQHNGAKRYAGGKPDLAKIALDWGERQ